MKWNWQQAGWPDLLGCNQDTRKPLTLWFRAAWWVASRKNGASALGLQRMLSLKGYKTAWTWLHNLRRAMVRPDRDRLTGPVEVDETYLAGLEEGVRGRQTESEALWRSGTTVARIVP